MFVGVINLLVFPFVSPMIRAMSPEEVRELTNTEVTSFLKSDVAQTICTNCHGIESLYRYRYYHQDRAFRLKMADE
jgi:hypothetical protein